jgi:drug/metabolite transporter (DMT)-like permease
LAPPDNPPRFPPWLGVAVAVASVSFAAPLFRLASAPPITASFWRLALAVAILIPFSRGAWASWRAYDGRAWLITAAAGVALGAHFGLWVASLQMTSVAASTALVTLQAIFVAIGGQVLLGDRLSSRNWLGVAVAAAGAMAIAWGDGGAAALQAAGTPRALAGDALALGAGVCSAAYFLIGRRLRQTRRLVEYVLPVYAFAAAALLVALPIARQPLLAGLGGSTFGLFVLLAAVPMLGGHTVANWTVRYLPAHVVATWILLEPVGAALLAWGIPAIAEVPSWWAVGGGALVLFGAALAMPRRVESPGAAAEPAG